MKYSYSAIDTFVSCPKKFSYRYIQKLPEKKSEALEKGISIHEDIEKNIVTEKTKDALSLVKEGKETKIEVETKEGTKKIYLNKKHPYMQEQEKKFGLTKDFSCCAYDDEKALLRGKIDFSKIIIDKQAMMKSLQIEGDGVLEIEKFIEKVEITDWKTGKRASAKGKKQLYLYAIYFFSLYPSLEKIEASLFFIDEEKDKRETFEITRKKADKEKERLLAKIEEIEISINRNSFPCKVTPLCAWCGFQEICSKENGTVILKQIE